MRVVGNCPSCGNPIYGVREIKGAEIPMPKRSCVCVPLGIAQRPAQRLYPPLGWQGGATPGKTSRFHHGDGDEALPS